MPVSEAGRRRQVEFWDLIRAGDSASGACEAVEVNRRQGYRWIKAAGGRVPVLKVMASGRYLSRDDRLTIVDLHLTGAGVRQIARELDRPLDAPHAGDTLVITTLDRLGRPTANPPPRSPATSACPGPPSTDASAPSARANATGAARATRISPSARLPDHHALESGPSSRTASTRRRTESRRDRCR